MNDLWRPLDAMTVHPLAAIFPMLSEDELDELAADIKANGLLHPIVRTVDGKVIVDGRNRYEACCRAGVEPTYDDRIRTDDEARALIASANVTRRHLTKAQRAMGHAMLYPEGRQGERSDLKATSLETKEVTFSAARLSQARTVLHFSGPLAEQVLAGEVSLDKAYETATEADRTRRRRDDETDRLRGVAPDLADRVAAKELALDEAWTLHNKRDEAARETRRGVFHAWGDIGRATRWIAQTPSVLDLPAWLDVEEYDTEFRQYFKGGVPELIKSLEYIDAARAAAINLIGKLNDRRKK